MRSAQDDANIATPAARAAADAETIACRMTPAGRGAIAVIYVRGPKARAAISACFQPLRTGVRLAPGAVVLGNWTGPQPTDRDEADRRAPEKLIVGGVDETSFEINCHGGRAAVDTILADLQTCGARVLEPADFQQQQHPRRLEAVCEAVLLRTSTRRTAAIALDQLRGTLRAAIEGICDAVEQKDTHAAVLEIEALLQRADAGLHVAEPWTVAIAGRPNVGKSSLMNALLGYRRAITADLPGTTRDRVTAETAVDGWPIQLVDMAGVRTGADVLEQQGVRIASRAILRADLVLSLASPDVPALEQFSTAHPPLRIWTKSDLASAPPEYDLAISAKTGAGIDQLWRRIASRLVPHPPQPGDAVPLASAQVEALGAATVSLRKGRLDDAHLQLRSLLTR